MSGLEVLSPRPLMNSTTAEDGASGSWEESYRPLPVIFLALLTIWAVLLGLWAVNTWTKRHCQLSNLQWALLSVPVLKSLVLGMSFVFWYSCLSLDTCSFWVAFGVFVSRIFFETACFVAFLLLAHGYCITHEQLTLTERRKIAALAGLLYLTLTGYKAAIPQFSVLVVAIYGVLLYCIFHQCALNLAFLRAQQRGILEDGLQGMEGAVNTKLAMLKRFRGAMVVTLGVQVLMHAGGEGMADEYWIRLLVREALELAIFTFIGWTFRSRQQSPFFAVMPARQEEAGPRKLPPIHSVEMDEREFQRADFREWHIGVPVTSALDGHTMIVIVQNPCQVMRGPEPIAHCQLSTACAASSLPPPVQLPVGAPPPCPGSSLARVLQERWRATFGGRDSGSDSLDFHRVPGSAAPRSGAGAGAGWQTRWGREGGQGGVRSEGSQRREREGGPCFAKQGGLGADSKNWEGERLPAMSVDSPEKRRAGWGSSL